MLDQVLSCTVVGSVQTVQSGLAAFIERTRPDEIMTVSQIFDPVARIRSLELTAHARAALERG